MSRNLRIFFFLAGIVTSILCAGFFLEIPLIQQTWPWPITRLSSVFLASIYAAIAAPVFWLAFSGEKAALAVGAINLIITMLGIGIFSLQLYFADNSRQAILLLGIVTIIVGLACIWLFLISYKAEFQDKRPQPAFVRYSLLAFVLALFITGGLLLLKTPSIFPWDLTVELRVTYGWFFYGALGYFAYGFYKPLWANAIGQLLSFLAYDLILIVPYLQHFATVTDEQRLSLILYVAVLLSSGTVAVYFLFINSETRLRMNAAKLVQANG